MKKIIACLGATILSATLAIAFAGCSSAPVSALATEKKYYADITADVDIDDRVYYLFHADGTGELYYYCYYNGSSYQTLNEYTVYFDYTFIDKDMETIVCVFDRVEAGERNKDELPESDWARILMVSEDVIMNTSGSVYYNEDFLTEHPNFGA